jgi:hypothetical protein
MVAGPSRSLLHSLALVCAVTAAAAVRSPACPNGCVIATTNAPRRCECIEERCSRTAAAPVAAALTALAPKRAGPVTLPFATSNGSAAPASARGRSASTAPLPAVPGSRSVVPPRALLPDNCGACSGFNAYASMEACAAGASAFAPSGRGIPPGSYPQLADTQRSKVAEQLSQMMASLSARPQGAAAANASAAAGRGSGVRPAGGLRRRLLGG